MKKILIVLLAWLPIMAMAQEQQDSHAFKVMKHLEIFNKAYTELDPYYVDTLDAEKRLSDALHYLMASVDPYTDFFEEQNSHALREMRTGKYAGIGSPIYFRKDLNRAVFNHPYPEMPAGKVGLRTGDIVLRIDTMDMVPRKDEDGQAFLSRVTDHLRGEAGSSFQLCVKRPWVQDSLLTFTLTREMIARPSVSIVHLTPDSIGYIRLDNYIETTTQEVKRAFLSLKQQGMKQLVLDLRSNGGGLLHEAVGVVGLFMPRGTKVVETKSKLIWLDETSETTDMPIDTTIPIVVMVNEGTASAAEITSGALQDYDRAVIVGRRTYGKGLVQTTRELPYHTALKVTISKYIIPSGRCVQAYKYEKGEPVYQPDSLAKTFYTRNGRPVKDGGGILPDVIVEADTLPEFAFAIQGSTQTEDFCVKYQNTHPTIAPAKDFKLADAEFEDYKKFMKEQGYAYKSRATQLFKLLEDVAQREHIKDFADCEAYKAVKQMLVPPLESELNRHRDIIKELLEIELVRSYYSDQGVFDYSLSIDKEIQRAFEVLRNEQRYHEILSGKK